MSFHSLPELSGLMPAKEFLGISKLLTTGEFRQFKALSLLDTVRVVTTFLNSWYAFRSAQAFASGSQVNCMEM